MFYQTRIQSVGYGYAIDIHGKSLSFIGDLPVKKGDTVYTDGNVIFGHVPPRGAPAIFDDEPSGIPVLADDLRGYFTLSGVFKKYKIAGDNWITNSKKIYQHDNGKDNVIDAEIVLDEDDNEIGYYTVKKEFVFTPSEDPVANDDKFYAWLSRSTGELYHMYLFQDKAEANTDTENITEKAFALSAQNADYSMFDDSVLKDCNLVIKKNGVDVQTLSLSALLENVETETKKYIQIDIPDHDTEDHIKSRAVIRNFKILPDGNWTALISAEIFAERYTKLNSYINYNVGSSNTSATDFFPLDNDFIAGDAEQIVAQFNALGWTTLTVEDWIKDNGLANAIDHVLYDIIKRKGRICTTSITTTPTLTRTDAKFIYNTAAYGNILFSIDSTDTLQILYQKFIFTPLYMTESTTRTGHYTPSASERAENAFPRITYSSKNYYKNGTKQTLEIYALYGATIVKPPISTGSIASTPYTSLYYSYDSSVLPDAPDYDNGKLEFIDSFTFPVQDGYYVKLINSNEKNEWLFGGIFDKDGKQVVGAVFQNDYTIDHTNNYSFVPLKGNSALLGLRNKQIFKIDKNGDATEVADALKNFRLRELKKISKAKK